MTLAKQKGLGSVNTMVCICPRIREPTTIFLPFSNLICVVISPDHETAMSAVRNLNHTDVKGRPLRIDLADSDPFLEGKTTTRGELEGEQSKPGPSSGAAGIPQGVSVPPGSSALDVISNVIATMQPQQLMDIMGHMKVSAVTHTTFMWHTTLTQRRYKLISFVSSPL